MAPESCRPSGFRCSESRVVQVRCVSSKRDSLRLPHPALVEDQAQGSLLVGLRVDLLHHADGGSTARPGLVLGREIHIRPWPTCAGERARGCPPGVRLPPGLGRRVEEASAARFAGRPRGTFGEDRLRRGGGGDLRRIGSAMALRWRQAPNLPLSALSGTHPEGIGGVKRDFGGIGFDSRSPCGSHIYPPGEGARLKLLGEGGSLACLPAREGSGWDSEESPGCTVYSLLARSGGWSCPGRVNGHLRQRPAEALPRDEGPATWARLLAEGESRQEAASATPADVPRGAGGGHRPRAPSPGHSPWTSGRRCSELDGLVLLQQGLEPRVVPERIPKGAHPEEGSIYP